MKTMLKKILGIGLLTVVTYSYANLKYDPAQLKQFDQTNTCPNCDLSGANLINLLSTVNHSGARISGINLSNAIGVNADSTVTINLSGADLTGANLTRVQFTRVNLSLADLTNAVFYGADLTQANLYGAKNANLAGAYVCNAVLPDGTIGKCN